MSRFVLMVVLWCWRHPVRTIIAAAIVTVALGAYAATHLDLDTDENHMISADLPFRQAGDAMDKAFPDAGAGLVAVIDAPTPELAENAVNRLMAALAPRTALFRSVRRPVEETFFRAHGLLFLSVDELNALSERLIAAQPLLGSVARDVSLRGLLDTVNQALEGVRRGQTKVDELAPLLDRLDTAAEAAAAGRPVTPLSWGTLMGGTASADPSRRFLLIQPVLQYDQLEAGHDASEAIRAEAATLGIDAAHGMRVRLTGSVALADANFATVAEGAEITAPLMMLAMVVILFVAVRSAAMVFSVLVSLVAGLVATGAFAAATVGVLNPISIAFAVMFVGIAVDFAIQFIVRYRAEHYRQPDPTLAMRDTGRAMAMPLSVAALATALGFLSFLPTQYTGVSQLGLIAGGGMIIALIVDFTLLPALLALLRRPTETETMGLPLDRADRWLKRNARAVLAVATLFALTGAGLMLKLPADFNPLHLQNPKNEAVATFNDLASEPNSDSYAVNVLTSGTAEAAQISAKLDAMPEVGLTLSLATFVPDNQDEKRAILENLAIPLLPILSPQERLPAPTVDELRRAMLDTARDLGTLESPTARTKALAEHLTTIANGSPDIALSFQDAVVGGLAGQIETLGRMVSATDPVTLDTLPEDLVRNWRAADGTMRVQVSPKEDLRDDTAMNRFAAAIATVTPRATGLPVDVVQSGKTVVDAFAQAAACALAAIALLLWFLFKRVLDAVLVILPLVIGALYTVIGCVVGGLAINFANIIALPLLLGIGVAFNIYFVVNWRNDIDDHLSSATARAILFSALTTGTAFGSLAVSQHLGTASMGLLLFLSLGLSVFSTFIVLPALFHVLRR